MNKSNLVELIASRGNLPKKKAEEIVGSVFDLMIGAMKQDDHIEIRGFGSFSVRNYKPYTGRNPRTGLSVQVKPKRLPFFKVGKELKELVNKGGSTI